MAQISGTYSTYGVIGQRESLDDRIFLVAREETPFMSNARQKAGSATREEWQTETLRAAAVNAKIEGDEFAFATPTATARVSNMMQISTDTVIVTRTADRVRKAGRATELGYQIIKKMKEIKRDMELGLLNNQASVVGNNSTARQLGGFPAWLTSNVSRGGSGANGGFSAGVVAAATDGTTRAFTETLFKAVLKSAYDNGGRPKLAYMNSTQKQAFSAFTGNAVNRIDYETPKNVTIVAAADVYLSDFGKITTVLSPQQRQRDVFLVDPNMVEVRFLQKPTVVPVAKTGDAEKKAIVTEYTLAVLNEKAHGVVADCT